MFAKGASNKATRFVAQVELNVAAYLSEHATHDVCE